MVDVENLRRTKSNFKSDKQLETDKSPKTWGEIQMWKAYVLLKLMGDCFNCQCVWLFVFCGVFWLVGWLVCHLNKTT